MKIGKLIFFIALISLFFVLGCKNISTGLAGEDGGTPVAEGSSKGDAMCEGEVTDEIPYDEITNFYGRDTNRPLVYRYIASSGGKSPSDDEAKAQAAAKAQEGCQSLCETFGSHSGDSSVSSTVFEDECTDLCKKEKTDQCIGSLVKAECSSVAPGEPTIVSSSGALKSVHVECNAKIKVTCACETDDKNIGAGDSDDDDEESDDDEDKSTYVCPVKKNPDGSPNWKKKTFETGDPDLPTYSSPVLCCSKWEDCRDQGLIGWVCSTSQSNACPGSPPSVLPTCGICVPGDEDITGPVSDPLYSTTDQDPSQTAVIYPEDPERPDEPFDPEDEPHAIGEDGQVISPDEPIY